MDENISFLKARAAKRLGGYEPLCPNSAAQAKTASGYKVWLNKILPPPGCDVKHLIRDVTHVETIGRKVKRSLGSEGRLKGAKARTQQDGYQSRTEG